MDVDALRKRLFEGRENDWAHEALREAISAGISLYHLLEGTILNGFLDKEITKFSECSITNLPNHRYDFRLNVDFSFMMMIFQLDKDAAMPITQEEIQGHWELIRIDEEAFILKLQGNPILENRSYLKVSQQSIGWLDKI